MPSQGRCTRNKEPAIAVLALTSLYPLRPPADDALPRRNRAGRVVPTRREFFPLGRRGPQLREVTGVGRGITVDRHDGERMRLTNDSSRYEHVLAHNLRVSFETALPQEQFAPREPAPNPLSRMIHHSSTLKATLFAPPNQGVRDLCRSPCDDTHSSGPARSRLFCECDHRADELIGLKVDVPGEFTTDSELVFVQEP